MRNCTSSPYALSLIGSEAEEKISELAGDVVLPVAFAVMLTLGLSAQVERCKLTWLPESAVVIAVGVGLGGILILMLGSDRVVDNKVLHEVSAPLLNLIFLPIIIFESGWNLRVKDFAAQVQYILIFAVFGSLISMAVVGALFHATAAQHGISSWRTALAYASLIAATDPVATLATYSKLQVEPLLNIMVFGESTINDAVAIVVFDIMNTDSIFGAGCSDTPTENVLKEIFLGVMVKLFGSIAVGIGLAIIYTLTLRAIRLQHSQFLEILYISTSAYLTFALSEKLHCSGIIATLFCSMTMGIYTKSHLSNEGQLLASFFVKGFATMADTGIFLLVGVQVLAANSLSLTLSCWVIAFCLLGRFAAVLLCGLAVNVWKSREGHGMKLPKEQWHLLSTRHLFMMWHAGLRGGIALVLALELGDFVDDTDGDGTKKQLVSCTLLVIIVFLLVFGGTTPFCLKFLGISMGEEFPEDFLWREDDLRTWQKCAQWLHKRVLWPLLVGAESNSSDSSALPDVGCGDVNQMLQSANAAHRHHAFYTTAAATSTSECDADEEDSSSDTAIEEHWSS